MSTKPGNYDGQTYILCEKCGQPYTTGDWPYCPHGKPHGGSLLEAIHPSERPVVLKNPRTGEVRIPPVDGPIHPKYAKQGYVREELRTFQELKTFEKTTGRIHEASNYTKNDSTSAAEKDLTAHLRE